MIDLVLQTLQQPVRLPRSVTHSRPEATTSPPLRALVGSRALIWGAGLLAVMLVGVNHDAARTLDPASLTAPFRSLALDRLVAPAGHWDSAWYLSIAQHGYFSSASSNFFPLYPVLIALGSTVIGQPLLVGMAIAFAATCVSLMLLYRLTLLDFNEPTAGLTVLLVSLYPMSFFLSSVYTESLFLLLSVGAFYAARTERWMIVGLCAALASATRSDGVVLLLPLGLIYLYGPRGGAATRAVGRWWVPRYRIAGSAAWLALAPAGLALYMGYLAITHGAPLAPFHAAETDWGRSFAGPFGAVIRLFGLLPGDIHGLLTGSTRSVGPGDPLSWNAHDLIDLGFLAAGVASLAVSWRRVPMPYFAYALTVLVYSCSFPYPNAPLQALPRYLLPVFPLFMGTASWLTERPRLRFTVLGISGALLATFSALWACWVLIP